MVVVDLVSLAPLLIILLTHVLNSLIVLHESFFVMNLGFYWGETKVLSLVLN